MDVNRIPPILLQTFLTVAEAGQISEAARRLHLSQPAVTGHIRRLEANLETTLFIRSANGVSLTERGAHLRERVQDVFAELEQILQDLDRTREVNGTLTLAASTTVARYFVPRIFIRFHHHHPDTALHLIVGNTEEVLDHLRQQRVGLGLVEGHQRSPGVHSSDRLTFLVFEFSGCFPGHSPAASWEDSLVSSISSPTRFEASYPRCLSAP